MGGDAGGITFPIWMRQDNFSLRPNPNVEYEKGTNTLAVQTQVRYEADKQAEGQFHPVGQIDLSLEGLKQSEIVNRTRSGFTREILAFPAAG